MALNLCRLIVFGCFAVLGACVRSPAEMSELEERLGKTFAHAALAEHAADLEMRANPWPINLSGETLSLTIERKERLKLLLQQLPSSNDEGDDIALVRRHAAIVLDKIGAILGELRFVDEGATKKEWDRWTAATASLEAQATTKRWFRTL